jgi:hypothetical protein
VESHTSIFLNKQLLHPNSTLVFISLIPIQLYSHHLYFTKLTVNQLIQSTLTVFFSPSQTRREVSIVSNVLSL